MGETNQKDLVLVPGQFAYILDETKGNVSVWCGACKVSLSNTDSPVKFSSRSKKFELCSLEDAKQLYTTAPENWYVVLKNPTQSGSHPKDRQSNDFAELDIGRKVNVTGPISFALYPGQMAKVIRGHALRSNQYLLVRVYDAKEAEKNWNSGVINTSKEEAENKIKPPEFVNGQIMVIKGTDVSFYIPPTGIEVLEVNNQDGKYVREAVTLERLEYCVLKNENGDKRYVQGPNVVFPGPTEVFIPNDEGNLKYKAYELSDISGIYVKVVADYSENGIDYKVGQELFLTGKDMPIYIPRPEHAIISYEGHTINHAIAIPEGEGRYVLNRLTGNVETIIGPTMLLPDPRTQVIVKRVLTESQAALWYPNNKKVYDYNNRLRKSLSEDCGYVVSTSVSSCSEDNINLCYTGYGGGESSITRKNSFTKPRTITLQSNDYDGAVSIDVWTGYAVKVVDKSGNSKIITGPTTYLMKYNESLEVMELSSGKPKTTDNLIKTVYLRVKNNKVSDIIPVETKDFCTVEVKVSYNVEFVGETSEEKLKWFDSDNCVKLLCDRMKSKIRRKVKTLEVEEFYTNAAEIISDIVLGEDHVGTIFSENNMKVFDIEIITVKIKDEKISQLFENNQYETIEKQLSLSNSEAQSEINKKLVEFDLKEAQIKFESDKEHLRLEREINEEKSFSDQLLLEAEQEISKKKLAIKKEKEQALNEISELTNMRDRDEYNIQIEKQKQEDALKREMIKANSEAFKEKMGSFTPGLIEALNGVVSTGQITEIAKSVSPYVLAGQDESVADVIRKLKLDSNSIEGILSLFNK